VREILDRFQFESFGAIEGGNHVTRSKWITDPVSATKHGYRRLTQLNLSRLAVSCVAIFAVLLPLVGNALGQSQASSATLTGTVSDKTGAVIPGALVTLTNHALGFQREQRTPDTGIFTFTLLSPGIYSLSVQKQGLSTFTETNISMEVGQKLDIPVSLSVGNVSEEVTVTSATPQLDTEDANISSYVDGRAISQLPLNQRNIVSLTFLNAAVTNQALTQWTGGTSANQPNADQDLTFLNFAGSRFGDTEYLLDGHWDVDPQWGGIIYTPGVEETQEFRLQSNSFSAQFGFSSGNVINMVTKSGSDELHGSVFDFLRNSAADARNYFDHNPQTHFERNQFGFTLGGPVILPHIYSGRRRTFFFGSYEGLRAASPVTSTETVPTAAERGGDFSALLGSPIVGVKDSLGRQVYAGAIYDPYSARPIVAGQIDPVSGLVATSSGVIMDPFGGVNGSLPTNLIPTSRFDKLASTLLQYYPNPTNSNATNNYTFSGSSPQQQDSYTVRIDQNIGDKASAWGRFSNRGEFKTGGVALYGSNDPGGPGLKNGDNRWDAAGGYSLNLSSSLVLSLNIGWNRWIETNVPQGNPFDVTQLGWLPSLNVGGGVFPNVNLSNGYAGLGSGSPQTAPREARSIGIDITKTYGRQLYTLGFDFTSQYYNNLSPGNASLSFVQNGTAGFDPVNPGTVGTETGDSFASLLLGAGTGNFQQSGSQTANMKKVDWYIQDDWKVKSDLTLNLGLRYELQPSPTDRFNKMAWFDPTAVNPITSMEATQPVGGVTPPAATALGELVWPNNGNTGRGVITNSYFNLAPRIGFSYHPLDRLVIRGAWGIFYPQRASVAFDANLNGYTQQTYWQDKNSAISGNSYALTTPASQAFESGLLPIVGNALGGLTGVGASINAIQHDWKSPFVQDYTLGVQYALTKNDVLDVAYIGNKGTNLPVSGSLNQNQLSDEMIAQAAQTTASTGVNPMFNLVLNPFYTSITQAANGGCGLQGQYVEAYQLERPFPEYCDIYNQQVPIGFDTYNSLMATWTHRFSHGLQVLASYNRSKWIDDVTGNAAWSWGASNQEFRDNTNIAMNKSVDASDVPNSLVVSYIYQIPIGRGQAIGSHLPRAVDAAVGGWQISGISTFRNGVPLSLTDDNNTSYSMGGGQTPDQVHTPQKVSRNWNAAGTGIIDFDTSAFQQAENFTFGNTQRNLSYLRGPGTDKTDFALEKYFLFTEKLRAQFRIEAFDVFNHPVFTNPDTGLGDSNFGLISGAFQPRELQAAIKVLW
jgi:hypothetical protein